jgi:hypothetical protein
VTVYDLEDVKRQAQAVAAEYVLPKPFVFSELQEMIDECLTLADEGDMESKARSRERG